MTQSTSTPWYRQFWPWMLILLPASAVTASLFTVFLFNQNKVSLVSEDYYKEGKGINLDLSRLRQAAQLNINADLWVKSDEVTISLDKGSTTQFEPIKITFQHRTLPEQDIIKMLSPDIQGNYRFTLTQAITGPWYVEISSYNDSWQINARANFPSETPIRLQGKDSQ